MVAGDHRLGAVLGPLPLHNFWDGEAKRWASTRQRTGSPGSSSSLPQLDNSTWTTCDLFQYISTFYHNALIWHFNQAITKNNKCFVIKVMNIISNQNFPVFVREKLVCTWLILMKYHALKMCPGRWCRLPTSCRVRSRLMKESFWKFLVKNCGLFTRWVWPSSSRGLEQCI